MLIAVEYQDKNRTSNLSFRTRSVMFIYACTGAVEKTNGDFVAGLRGVQPVPVVCTMRFNLT